MPDHILVVDDEEDIREIYVRALESEGFDVDSAAEAKTALQLLTSNRYAIIVADIRMPGMDGITLLEKVREQCPETDVIIATGYPATDTAIQALRLGAFDYIIKPFTLEELIHTVGKALQTQKLSRENLLLKRMNAIYEVSSAFSTTMGLNGLLELILEKGMKGVEGEGGAIYLLQKEDIEKAVEQGPPFESYENIVEKVLQSKESSTEDVAGMLIAGMPLLARGEQVGVLCIRRTTTPYTSDEKMILRIFAEQAASAIRDARVHEELQKKIKELEVAYVKLKEAQEQLLRAEKLSALGELAAGVAHEINNPLATILGYVQVLGRNEALEEKEKRFLRIMEQEVERMARIVMGLLNFAHPEAPKRKKCSLLPLIDETLLITEHQIARYGPIEIRKEINQDIPDVNIDRNQIQQVLVNLLLNAAQAMEGNGGILFLRIHSTSFKGSPAVAIEVEDTGRGVPDELQSKIFDPFFTTKEPGKGTGLGLSIAYGILENHGGTLALQKKEGKGANFIAILPGDVK